MPLLHLCERAAQRHARKQKAERWNGRTDAASLCVYGLVLSSLMFGITRVGVEEQGRNWFRVVAPFSCFTPGKRTTRRRRRAHARLRTIAFFPASREKMEVPLRMKRRKKRLDTAAVALHYLSYEYTTHLTVRTNILAQGLIDLKIKKANLQCAADIKDHRDLRAREGGRVKLGISQGRVMFFSSHFGAPFTIFAQPSSRMSRSAVYYTVACGKHV